MVPLDVHVSYQFQYRRCGKCAKCKQGPGHGPYFYAYWCEERKPKSKSMGKVLQIEIVRSYFRQTHRLSVEEMPIHWRDFKRSTLRASVADDTLTQEQLRILALKCKEKCRSRKKDTSAILLEQIA